MPVRVYRLLEPQLAIGPCLQCSTCSNSTEAWQMKMVILKSASDSVLSVWCLVDKGELCIYCYYGVALVQQANIAV